MRDIAIYGAGGFGREVACLINYINEFWSWLNNSTGHKSRQQCAFGCWKRFNDKPKDWALYMGNPAKKTEF